MIYKKYDFCEKEELCRLILTCKIEYEQNVTKNTNTSMINWKKKKHSETAKTELRGERCA